MPFKYILTVLFITYTSIAHSQRGSIHGIINDADSKTPLTGATVNIGGNKSDNSDAFGKFSIPIVNPGQYELIVSHIGYKTEIVPVEVKADLLSTITISLKRAELDLSEVRINSKRNNGLQTISAVDIKLRPVNTSQDVLRIVPGLFIAQHAGGGKAEQIFLRGYDIDHGTDIAITVDGMPVNMISHAHGQGYADLHFLIPETIEKINFEKGPYQAAKGNLATAAWVDFSTRDFLEKNMIKAEAGQFNSQRFVTQLKLFSKTTEQKKEQVYIASEYARSDGYFESPQDFHRFNIMGKYTAWFGNQSQLSIIGSGFSSRWNASGQVPERAIRAGLITRFGAIDNTEGGNTSRINFTARFQKQWKKNWKSTDQFYYSHYRFNLFSNFTFFLNDLVNGDMINQRERRDLFGYTTTAAKSYFIGNKKAATEMGAGFRQDNIHDIELAHANRKTLFNSIRKGDIRETNSFAYINQDIEMTDRLQINAGLRFDHFIFRYKDKLNGADEFAMQSKATFSPKLNISYAINARLKISLQNGIGFHSNDTRVILDNAASDILPRVIGTDLGLLWKPLPKMVLKTTLWHLYSQQEFVYVGDEGIVEPGGRTRRMGVDLSARYQFSRWLFADADINVTKARGIDAAKGENYIPLAPSFTSIGGLTVRTKQGFSSSLRYRFIGNRPANETNSVQAQGYFLLDMVNSYKRGRFEFSLSAENLTNRNWREAQFDTESRLRQESSPVSEIHFTPGTPFYLKGGITYSF
ncbi:MAG: TonB-dependent receptor [Bacteroidetes bacterium]|nr:TonB-dependent receptor [Bacteroidota bacterium]